MKYYQINNAGINAIKLVLIDCHKTYNRMSDVDQKSCLFAYCSDAENSANDGDSVAVWEISARQNVAGFSQAYTLDLKQFFDVVECEG